MKAQPCPSSLSPVAPFPRLRVTIPLFEARVATGGRSLADAQRSSADWQKAVGKVARLIRDMPLWRLQTVGNQPLEFLYRHAGDGTAIELEPGVMFCFRRFHALVSDLVRGAWVRYVRRLNQDVLGTLKHVPTLTPSAKWPAAAAPYAVRWKASRPRRPRSHQVTYQ